MKGQQKARVNIPRSVKDIHYRYTMAAIEAKVEGSGNGIKTKIPNLSEISKDLHRDPADILRMFGFELGAVTINKDETDTYIVNGKFTANDLAEVLDKFIEKFVLCGSCRNPETRFKASKGTLKLHCISCGNDTVCDSKHKLTDALLKDAAKRKAETRKASAAAEKKERGAEKKERGGGGGGSKKDDDDDGGDAEQWSVDTSSAAVKARRKAALGEGKEGEATSESNNNNNNNNSNNNSNNNNSASSSSSSANGKSRTVEQEFVDLVKKDTGAVDMDRLRTLRDALRLSPAELAQKIAQLIFDSEGILKQIPKESARWASFFISSSKTQEALVHYLVELALLKEDTLLPHLATLLKGVYDKDYVEEDAILAWYENVDDSDQRLLKAKLKVAPLAQWFKEAEEED